MLETMKVVILCGGAGTRLREETEFRPKPMVNIGARPILWNIMKYTRSFSAGSSCWHWVTRATWLKIISVIMN